MQQESSSPSSGDMMNMENYSSPAQIRSAMANLRTPSPFSSIFYRSSNCSSPATPPAKSDSNPVTGGGNSTSSSAAAINSLSRLMSEHREVQSRYFNCLDQLRRTFQEAETLRQENTNLRIANNDLNLLIGTVLQRHHKKVPMFPEPYEQYRPTFTPLTSATEWFGGLSFGGKKIDHSGGSNEGFSSDSPTSVIENNRTESQNVETGRVTLPKSISVRSDAFLKLSQATADASTDLNSGLGHGTTRIRAQNSVPGPQKVYVRGGRKKEGPIELDVYNQGMFKTELCNKWQETGACPYEDKCQFAHGIGELRPVIRHPRYKTELCRMIFSGDPCPYGHRCHFRHALTDQEKLIIAATPELE